MLLSRKQKDELTKLRILAYLSNRPTERFFAAADDGATATEISSVMKGEFNRERLLREMKEAGLIGRQEESEADRRLKPYFITDNGRLYLEDAQQKAMLLEPWQREGWAKNVDTEKLRGIAGVIRCLPEFQGSEEARIHEVARGLAEAIGFTVPYAPDRAAERSGR